MKCRKSINGVVTIGGEVKTNELRIKLAKAFDRLITVDGKVFVINETSRFEYHIEDITEVENDVQNKMK